MGDGVAVRVEGARRGVHVAVVVQVGLERAEQVGVVLAVVGDQGLDGVLVEAAHLLRLGGEGAEQQAVDAVADPVGELLGHPLVAAHHLEHQLGLGDRPAQLAGDRAEGREGRRPVRAKPAREQRAAARVRSGASSPQRAGRIA